MNLTAAQRVLLYILTRRRKGASPFAVIIAHEQAARQLAKLGLVTVQRHDDFDLIWINVTPVGLAAAAKLFVAENPENAA